MHQVWIFAQRLAALPGMWRNYAHFHDGMSEVARGTISHTPQLSAPPHSVQIGLTPTG